MKVIKTLILSTLISIAISSFAFAQMEIEVGGEIEAQVGFRGVNATYPFLVPSSITPLILDPVFRVPGSEFNVGIKHALVTDSLIDIWATGRFDCECLGDTTYGAKIELFADPTHNKYSVDSWYFTLFPILVLDPPPFFPGSSSGFIPAFITAIPDLMGMVDLFAPFIPTATPNPGPAREAKIFVENRFGKFEIGDTIGATKHLQVDAATLAVGSGGIAGDARLWATSLQLLGMFASADMITNKVAFYYVDPFFSLLPTTTTIGYFDFAPLTALLTTATFNGIGTQMRYSGKASYYTPRCAGFAGGISYIPDTDIYGTVSQITTTSRTKSPFVLAFKDVIEAGINYDCKISDIGIKAAVVGEVGKSKAKEITTLSYDAYGGLYVLRGLEIDYPIPLLLPRQAKDLRAYEFGLGFDYCGFEVAGSYGVNKALIEGLKDNKYWTLGAGYTYCDFGLSINYMDNRQKSKALRNPIHQVLNPETLPTVSVIPLEVPGRFTELKYRNFVLDVEYRICDGLIPYASYAHINVHQPFNANMESKFNQGIGLIGLRILF